MLFTTYRSINFSNARTFSSFSWLVSNILPTTGPVPSNVVMAPGYVEYGAAIMTIRRNQISQRQSTEYHSYILPHIEIRILAVKF